MGRPFRRCFKLIFSFQSRFYGFSPSFTHMPPVTRSMRSATARWKAVAAK